MWCKCTPAACILRRQAYSRGQVCCKWGPARTCCIRAGDCTPGRASESHRRSWLGMWLS